MINSEFDMVQVIKQLRYLRMRRQLAMDGLASRPEIAAEAMPRDIDEMNERIKKTREGKLEIRTLGVGDNLIVVDD